MDCTTKELTRDSLKRYQKHLVFEDRHYQCFCAYGHEFDNLMQIIGEERSRAFNYHCGLDRFDPYYLQVILWDNAKEQLIGGYRFALVDDFVKTKGWNSLYLNEHYHSLSNLLVLQGKTFELGRAFITPSYQKKMLALYLLGRGILQSFGRFPDYSYIIGSTSFSQQEINKKTQQLLIAGLRYGPYADNSFHIMAKKPYQEDAELSDHLLRMCEQSLSFDQLNLFITTETGAPFKAPQLLHYYTKHFNARCLAYAINDPLNTVDVLQRGTLKQVSDTFKMYVDQEQHEHA